MPRAITLSAGLLVVVASCEPGPDPAQARALAEALTSAESHIDRQAAMWQLLDMESDAVPYLAEVLGRDDESEPLDWAAAVLGELGPDADLAVPDLVASLEGVDPEAVGPSMRMFALGRIGSAAVPALVAALEHGNSQLKVAALKSLTNMDPDVDLRAAIPLATRLVGDGNAKLHQAASWLLERHPKPAVPELIGELERARKKG